MKSAYLFWITALFYLSSCNIYSPLASKSSDLDLVEEGLKCEHSGDYDCAISQYSEIANSELKNEKLCLAYLSKGGITLNILTDIITQNNSKMLGALAQALVPWTSNKSDALDNAQTACAGFQNTASNTVNLNRAVLLRSMGYMAHCAIRIAKTDQYVSATDGDSCNSQGNRNAIVETTDVVVNGDGSIDASHKGMCATDANTCSSDINAIDGNALTNAGLSEIKAALANIPAGISGGANAAARRLGIQGAI